ncbi:hypothetical protein OAN61_00575 [bacterium]|nr:hypothetical protein [bacterium]
MCSKDHGGKRIRTGARALSGRNATRLDSRPNVRRQRCASVFNTSTSSRSPSAQAKRSERCSAEGSGAFAIAPPVPPPPQETPQQFCLPYHLHLSWL